MNEKQRLEQRMTELATTAARTLRGYGVRWGDTAAIVESGERFDEKVVPGAFARSLQNGPPVLLFDHGRSPLGRLPVGRVVGVEEDSTGLAIEAELYDDPTFAPVLDAVQSGGLRQRSASGSPWSRIAGIGPVARRCERSSKSTWPRSP